MPWTYTTIVTLGSSYAGLTDLRAQLYDTSGSVSGSAITTGFTTDLASGRGIYGWSYSMANGFRGYVKFYSNASAAASAVAIPITASDEMDVQKIAGVNQIPPGTPGGLATARLGIGTIPAGATVPFYGNSYISPGQIAALLKKQIGITPVIRATSGNQILDTTAVINAQTIAANEVSAWIPDGLNDARTQGLNNLADFDCGVAFGLAKLLVPSANWKGRADGSITYAGAWSDADPTYGPLKTTSTSGDYLEFTTSADTIYIHLPRVGPWLVTGSFTIKVDGVTIDTEGNAAYANTANNPTNPIGGGVFRYAGLGTASKTIRLTNTSNTAAYFASWYGHAAGTSLGPKLILGTIPKIPAAGYAGGSATDAIIDRYNLAIVTNVYKFAQDGHCVTLANLQLDKATEFETTAPYLHPNTAGYGRIARDLAGAIVGGNFYERTGEVVAIGAPAESVTADVAAVSAGIEGSSDLASGTVASATGTTTTLDSGAVNTASYYNGSRLVLTSGTGVGQERAITSYSSGRVCHHAAWTTNPDNASEYAIREGPAVIRSVTIDNRNTTVTSA